MHMTANLESSIGQAAEALAEARYATGLAGAGMSAESGIPTFRGPDGLWTKYGEPSSGEYQRLVDDPKTWWEERVNGKRNRMPGMRESMAEAKPNPGHHALAELEEMGVMKYIVTQNVDNLHRAAGNVNIAEIHGNWTLMRCMQCNARFPQDDISLEMLPPLCPHCEGIVKGDIVMFGEPIPRDVFNICQSEALKSDCVMILGTSAVVYPAAALPELARRTNGATLIEFNPEQTALTEVCDIVVRAPTGEALPKVVERMKALARG
jgi:NAD-dependent deacetylase